MQIKSLALFLILSIFFGLLSTAQDKQEREHRIKKSQFPSAALQTISENNQDFKRLKFYKEVDSTSKTFTAKFKKSRLFYEMNFNELGELTDLGFSIKPVDIPEESFTRITQYFSQNFEKTKVRKMFQIYHVQQDVGIKKTLKNAFQNLMLPDVVYELFVKGKENGTQTNFEITFNSEGDFIHAKSALPANNDRVLY